MWRLLSLRRGGARSSGRYVTTSRCWPLPRCNPGLAVPPAEEPPAVAAVAAVVLVGWRPLLPWTRGVRPSSRLSAPSTPLAGIDFDSPSSGARALMEGRRVLIEILKDRRNSAA